MLDAERDDISQSQGSGVRLEQTHKPVVNRVCVAHAGSILPNRASAPKRFK
jgi:hypothetical protein